jgi:hypothetical protein
MFLIKWWMWVERCGLGVGVESIGLRELKEVKALEASKPDFTV